MIPAFLVHRQWFPDVPEPHPVGDVHRKPAGIFAHLCDFTRSGNETYDVDASVQYCYMWNELPDAGTCTVNIQDGDNQGIFIRGFFQQIFDGIQGIALHAYKITLAFSLYSSAVQACIGRK